MIETKNIQILREAMRLAAADRLLKVGIMWSQEVQEMAVQAALAAPRGQQLDAIDGVLANHEKEAA